MANSIITTETILKNRPGATQSFLTALLQGWKEALDLANQEKALATIQAFDRDTPPEILAKQLAATRKLMDPSSGKGIGWIDLEAWKQTEKIMLEQKLIKRPVSVERILKPDL